jgi:hypothetical protein
MEPLAGPAAYTVAHNRLLLGFMIYDCRLESKKAGPKGPSDFRFKNADFRFKSLVPRRKECMLLNLQSPI